MKVSEPEVHHMWWHGGRHIQECKEIHDQICRAVRTVVLLRADGGAY